MLNGCNEAQALFLIYRLEIAAATLAVTQTLLSCMSVVGCQDTAKFMLGMYKLTFKFGGMGVYEGQKNRKSPVNVNTEY